MLPKPLILLPLTVIILLALLSMSGLGAVTPAISNVTIYQQGMTNYDGSTAYYYDTSGHAMCFYGNLSGCGEVGHVICLDYGETAAWQNSTGTYSMFYDQAGEHIVLWASALNPGGIMYTDPLWEDGGNAGYASSFNLSGNMGWIALIILILGMGTLIGLKFFGSGLSETSVQLLFKGTAYLTVWGFFSALTYPMISGSGQFILYVGYFVLTIIYCLGIIFDVGAST